MVPVELASELVEPVVVPVARTTALPAYPRSRILSFRVALAAVAQAVRPNH
ncbi:unnamed protein product [marine sediment metagenome]|uniref:Uncharacterized protein n=1 Tax=marine sediment metagenome TaxID=412755 RepID=X1MTV6_9ZZZZ